MDFLKRLRNPLVGFVDARSARTIRGWARNTRADKPVTVEFYVDGKLAGSTIADRYRADLSSEVSHGRCAFEYTIPAQHFDGREQIVEVRPRGSGKPLTHGRFAVRLKPAQYYETLLRQILRHGLWAMAGGIENGVANIGGWLIAPPGSEGRIAVNGAPIAVHMREDAPDWTSPLPAGFAARAFAGAVPIDPSWTEMHFSFDADRPHHALHDYHYPLFSLPMPESERRVRVAGHDAEFLFNLDGYSIAKKLDVLSRRFAGRPLADLGPVLDWGCGSGRLSRFLARGEPDLYGVDIDADNVRWCADHIRGRFAAIALDPPSALPANFFGAICGISVFTHLSQDYEARWLADLHRIAKPGALLFLSVLGNVAAARDNLLEAIAEGEGFADVGRNPGIDAVTHGSAYYRNVFHQPEYIARVWGQYFDILSIEEGIVGNYQDMVVARKRG